MKTKILLVLLVLSTFILVSCGSQTYVCADGSTVDNIEECINTGDESSQSDLGTKDTTIKKDLPASSDVTFTLDAKELASLVNIEDYSYVAAPSENKFGDKSSIRNIAGTKKYEAFMQATMSFSQTSKYRDARLFVKVLGTGISGDVTEIVYEDYLTPDKDQTFDFSTILATQAESPRLKFCFGFTPDFDPFFEEDEQIACFTKRLDAPIHRLFLSKTEIDFSFDAYEAEAGDVLEVSKSIDVKNDGTVPTTFFTYVSNSEEQYTLEVSDASFFLNPGQQKTITFTGTWNYDGNSIFGRENAGVYTVGHACESSKECFDDARVSEEIDVQFHN